MIQVVEEEICLSIRVALQITTHSIVISTITLLLAEFCTSILLLSYCQPPTKRNSIKAANKCQTPFLSKYMPIISGDRIFDVAISIMCFYFATIQKVGSLLQHLKIHI